MFLCKAHFEQILEQLAFHQKRGPSFRGCDSFLDPFSSSALERGQKALIFHTVKKTKKTLTLCVRASWILFLRPSIFLASSAPVCLACGVPPCKGVTGSAVRHQLPSSLFVDRTCHFSPSLPTNVTPHSGHKSSHMRSQTPLLMCQPLPPLTCHAPLMYLPPPPTGVPSNQ